METPVTTIYCTELPTDFTEREFHNMFQYADGFEDSSLSLATGNKVMGFARFTTHEQANVAAMQLNGRVVDPATNGCVRVQMAQKQLKTSNRPSSSKRLLDTATAEYPPQKVQCGGGVNTAHSSLTPSYFIPPSSSFAVNSSYPGMNYGYEMSSSQPATAEACDTLHVTGMDTTCSEAEAQAVLQLLTGFKQMKYVTREGKNPFALVQFFDASYAASVQASSSGRLFLPSGRALTFAFAKSPLGVRKSTVS
jgi:hypothetical protein